MTEETKDEERRSLNTGSATKFGLAEQTANVGEVSPLPGAVLLAERIERRAFLRRAATSFFMGFVAVSSGTAGLMGFLANPAEASGGCCGNCCGPSPCCNTTCCSKPCCPPNHQSCGSCGNDYGDHQTTNCWSCPDGGNHTSICCDCHASGCGGSNRCICSFTGGFAPPKGIPFIPNPRSRPASLAR
jgi:hypothetical protein